MTLERFFVQSYASTHKLRNKDDNGQGRAIPYPYPYSLWVHNSTRIRTHGCESLPIPILRRVPIPIGYPTGGSNSTQVTHYFTFIGSTLGARTWDFDLLIVGRHVDYDQCLITRVTEEWDAQIL
jgi:hypothetical protein